MPPLITLFLRYACFSLASAALVESGGGDKWGGCRTVVKADWSELAGEEWPLPFPYLCGVVLVPRLIHPLLGLLDLVLQKLLGDEGCLLRND